MRAALAAFAVASLGLVAGCAHSTTHELESPASLPSSPSRTCSIGVGRFADDQGTDFALDLRDYLREHGPCTRVFAVSDEANEKADIVVSGSVVPEYDWASSGRTPETRGGQAWLLIGAILLPGSTVPLLVTPSNPNDTGTVRAIGVAAVSTCLAMGALGVGLIVDNGGRVQLIGKVTAEVDIRRPGAPADHLKLEDEFKIRERTPDRAQNDAERFGGLQRGGLDRVFEHIASRLDEVAALPPPPRPPSLPATMPAPAPAPAPAPSTTPAPAPAPAPSTTPAPAPAPVHS